MFKRQQKNKKTKQQQTKIVIHWQKIKPDFKSILSLNLTMVIAISVGFFYQKDIKCRKMLFTYLYALDLLTIKKPCKTSLHFENLVWFSLLPDKNWRRWCCAPCHCHVHETTETHWSPPTASPHRGHWPRGSCWLSDGNPPDNDRQYK